VNSLRAGKGNRLPNVGPQQAAVGLKGSGGMLKMFYSAEEMLKASMSIEGRINVLLVPSSRRVCRAAFGLCFLHLLCPVSGLEFA